MEKLNKLRKYRYFWPILALCIILLYNLIFTPNFFKIEIMGDRLYGNLIDILHRATPIMLVAIGMTLVIATGGIDLSVGAIVSITGSVAASLIGGKLVLLADGTQNYVSNYPMGLAITIAILVGVLCGAWNGFLVAKMKIQPMVATLILFTAGRGIAQLITDGLILYVRNDQYRLLGSFIPGLPVPTPVLVAALVVFLTWALLKFTALGIYIQAVGINPTSSRLVGLSSTVIVFLAYAFCGLCSGIAGMIITSRVYSIDANNAGLNMELDAILAVALGGNSLGGGKFSLAGSVIGAITIQALTTSLYAMGVTADQLPIYKAIVVVIIVSLQSPELKKFIAGIRSRKAVAGRAA